MNSGGLGVRGTIGDGSCQICGGRVKQAPPTGHDGDVSVMGPLSCQNNGTALTDLRIVI